INVDAVASSTVLPDGLKRGPWEEGMGWLSVPSPFAKGQTEKNPENGGIVLSTFLATFACLLSVLLTPLLRSLASRFGWVDQPDNHRKMHHVAVPRIGGVAIALAYIGAFGIFLLAGLHGSLTIEQSFPLVWRLLPAFVLVFAIGLIDD